MEVLRELALFAGAGGGILGGHLLGWECVCAVEIEDYPRKVLLARQRDGILPCFPIWDDVTTFDGNPWRGRVDVVSGGFPCQDISAAGKGAGLAGARSGLWAEFARIIGEVQPRFVLVENSPMLTIRGLGTVLGDLATLGYDARWGVAGAIDVGAPHERERLWIVGKATNTTSIGLYNKENKCILESQRWSELQFGKSRSTSEMAHTQKLFSNGSNNNAGISLERKKEPKLGNHSGACHVSDTNLPQRQGGSIPCGVYSEHTPTCNLCWWETEPNVGRMADGGAFGVDRLKAIGNGQVPAVVQLAWNTLSSQERNIDAT